MSRFRFKRNLVFRNNEAQFSYSEFTSKQCYSRPANNSYCFVDNTSIWTPSVVLLNVFQCFVCWNVLLVSKLSSNNTRKLLVLAWSSLFQDKCSISNIIRQFVILIIIEATFLFYIRSASQKQEVINSVVYLIVFTLDTSEFDHFEPI